MVSLFVPHWRAPHPWVAVMVINVACGPMAYKTQLLAYLLRRKPIMFFCDEMKKSDSDDIDKDVQYSM
jgi:hypothetical protein